MGALWEILKDRRGMKINHIYHSRFSPELIELEQPYNEYAKGFYAVLDTVSIPVTDLREPGLTGNIDGFNFKILGRYQRRVPHEPLQQLVDGYQGMGR